ncbi:MAG: hypothetical protein JW889_05945 [Verrucomicrobia bacterium]|nr:hypothetical protein [Verrucomicrobiota bacterium]
MGSSTRIVRWAVAAGLILVLVVAWHWFGGTGYGMLATVIFAVLIGVMIAPDIAWLGAHLFIGAITGENQRFEGPVQMYGPARSLAVEERWGEAIEAYRGILQMHPGDVEAQRAIAEICLEKMGDLDRGMIEYNALLSLKLEDAMRVTILMRLAELYERRFNRPDYAADCLGDILDRFPDTKYAAAARERLTRLRN